MSATAIFDRVHLDNNVLPKQLVANSFPAVYGQRQVGSSWLIGEQLAESGNSWLIGEQLADRGTAGRSGEQLADRGTTGRSGNTIGERIEIVS